MSDCLNRVDVTAWMAGFRRRAASARVPFTAHLELTSRCNLRCRHCYLGDQCEQHRKRSMERDTDAVKASIREWVEAGCLHLIITGGDPMMRPDFTDIYRYSCEQGLVVTVFCDGILVNEPILASFSEYPPRSVEVTVYGATDETYEAVTRVPGSYALAWKGIRRMLDRGVRVFLKTVLLSINEHELQAMRAQSEALGCSFRYDAAIFPCLSDGSQDPLVLRVPPEAVVAAELQDPALMEGFRMSIQHFEQAAPSENIYQCGAGQTSFYADPHGVLSPCLLTSQYRYAPDGRPFQAVWDRDLVKIRQKKRTRKDGLLVAGGLRGACAHCPAINYLETGDEEQDSTYMLQTARLRYAAVMQEGVIA